MWECISRRFFDIFYEFFMNFFSKKIIIFGVKLRWLTWERAREVRLWNIENTMLESKRYHQIHALLYRTRYFSTKTHENPKSRIFFFKFSFLPIFLTVYFTHIFKGVLWDPICGLKRFSKVDFFTMCNHDLGMWTEVFGD